MKHGRQMTTSLAPAGGGNGKAGRFGSVPPAPAPLRLACPAMLSQPSNRFPPL